MLNPSGATTTASTSTSGSNSLSGSNSKLDGAKGSGGSGSVTQSANAPLTKRQIITVSILCFVNLINYMDRYTIAGDSVCLIISNKLGHLHGH